MKSMSSVAWRSRLTEVASSAFLTFAAISCGGAAADSVAPVPPGKAASIVVAPSASSLRVGDRLPLQAHAQDALGQLVPGASIFWSSSDTTVATVSSIGVVTARAPGTVQIAASTGGQSAVATLTIVPIPVASLAVAPGSAVVSVGSRISLTAIAYSDARESLSGRPVVWASSAPSVAAVDPGGTVTGIAAGTATITATSEGKTASANITVTLVPVASVALSPGSVSLTVGQTAALTATAHDANGNVLQGRGVSWSSGNPSVATVSSSGMVTGVGVGSTGITATSEGRSVTAPVVVNAPAPGPPPPPVPVASLQIEPSNVSINVGGGIVLSATALDANKNVLAGRTVTWVSSAPQIASVNSSGMVTGVAVGTAVITAASEGRTATAQIEVRTPPPPPPAAVASVSITPDSASLFVGSTTTLVATPRSSAGEVLSGRDVTWATSAPGVATVSSSGVVTAVGQGTTIITATVEGRQGSATIVVLPQPPAPVADVVVSPASATLTPGGSVNLTAVARDASNRPLEGRTVKWISSAPQIASVDESGSSVTVTGRAVGTATITATVEGRSGTATITVNAPPPAPVASVSVTPQTTTLVTGNTATLTATPRDASGNALSGRTIAWASSAPGVATVSSSGVVTAVAAGTASITATSEGRTGSATVTVNAPPPPPPAPVASVTVSPGSQTLTTGATAQLTATTRDAQQNVLTGRTVTWTSSNQGVATVSQTGVVTAVSAGSATITATSEGRSGSATVTVQAPPPAPARTITVTPGSPLSLSRKQTVTLTASVYDANKQELKEPSINWVSGDNSLVTVTPTGASVQVRAGNRDGTTTIVVTSGDARTEIRVTVSNSGEGD